MFKLSCTPIKLLSRKLTRIKRNLFHYLPKRKPDYKSKFKLSYYQFGKNYEFYPINHRLVKVKDGDICGEITLESLQTRLLTCFVESKGEPLNRSYLTHHVWRRHFVDKRTINCAISKLRKQLSDDNETLIMTVRGQGYQFNPSVTEHYLRHQSKTPKLLIIAVTLLSLTSLTSVIYAQKLNNEEQESKGLTSSQCKR